MQTINGNLCRPFQIRKILILVYRKTPKNSDTRKFAIITLKVEQGGLITLE